MRSSPQCQSPPQFQQSVVDSCWSKEESAGARRVGDVSGSDTDSVVPTDDEAMDGSMVDDVEDNELPVVELVAPVLPSVAAQRASLNQLDHWNFGRDFVRRAFSLKTVSRFLWGSLPHCSESGFGGNCQWCRQEK